MSGVSKSSHPTFVDVPGAEWADATGVHRIVDVTHDQELGRVFVVEDPTGDHILMDPVLVWRSIADQVDEQGGDGMPPLLRNRQDDVVAWDGIRDDVRRAHEERARHLIEAVTGDPYGSLLTRTARGPQFITPRYDPARTPRLEDRMKLKSEELTAAGAKGASRSSLWEQLKLVERAGGARNLVHGNTGRSRSPLAKADVALLDRVEKFAKARHKSDSTSFANLLDLLYVDDRHIGLLNKYEPRVVEAALKAAVQRHRLNKSARRGRSERVRTPDEQGVWVANAPFECLQMDSTPFNAAALDLNGLVLEKPEIVMIYDPMVGKVRAFDIVASRSKYDSKTVRRLIWSTRAGAYFEPFPGVHDGTPTAPILARHFGSGLMDRGPQWNSIQSLGFMAGIATHGYVAAPGRGDRKPGIEAINGVVAANLAELLPGSKGRSAETAGTDDPRRKLLLRIDDLAAIVWLLIEGILHNRPRPGLASERYPHLLLTPNEAEQRYFAECSTLEVDPRPDRALDLLKVQKLVLSDAGIRVNGRTYWDNGNPDLQALRTYVREQGPNRQVAVYVDDARQGAVIVRGLAGQVIVVPDTRGGIPVRPWQDYLDRDDRDRIANGGALRPSTTELRDVRRLVVGLAHDLAVRPPSGGHPKPEPKPADSNGPSGPDRLTDVYRRIMSDGQTGE